MSETRDLLLVLQPRLALGCGNLQLTLFVLADVLDTDSLAEVGEYPVLRFVDHGGEFVNLLLQRVVVSLSLQSTCQEPL